MTDAEKTRMAELIPAKTLHGTIRLTKGEGCDACKGSGYMGRVGIHEVMLIDGPIRDAILRKESAADIKKLSHERGMVAMVRDGFLKATQGTTTIEEVLRVVHE